MSLAVTLLSTEVNQSVKARTANQLVRTSPVTNKQPRPANQDREFRERLDGANRMGVISINPEYRGMGKHQDLMILSDHVT